MKELEGFFGVALSRRVGRRIEITPEGHRLAEIIRRQFRELDDFRESMSGRPVCVRLGASASFLEWMVIPRLAACREALGQAIIELEPCRSAEIAAGVADGRLDFGIIREDGAPPGIKKFRLGRFAYSLFAPRAAWRSGAGVENIFYRHEFGELIGGGQFHQEYQRFLTANAWSPRIVARVGSFLQLARLVNCQGLAAVLPEIAANGFDTAMTLSRPLPWKLHRSMVLVTNPRGLDRVGIKAGAAPALARTLAWGTSIP